MAMRHIARRVSLLVVVATICTAAFGVVGAMGATAPPGTVRAASLGSTPWPSFGHDIGQTRRSPYLGVQTNQLKWSVRWSGDTVRSSAAIDADGTIYVGGGGTRSLHALNPDGSAKWTCVLGGAVWSSPAIDSAGTIYVGCYDGKLYAIDPDNGSIKWSAPTGVIAYESPAIGPDGTIYCGSYESTMHAFNPGDGSVKWLHEVGTTIFTGPSIDAAGTVYVAAGDLYAFDPDDGAVDWTFTGSDKIWVSPAIDAEGTLYFASSSGTVYALDSATHTPKWTPSSLGSPVVASLAIGTGGTVYVGCEDGNLHALDSTDGSVKWSHNTGGRIQSSPTVGSDGTVYVGSDSKKIEALDPDDGSVKWSYTTGKLVYASPVIGADGTVYVGSDDGFLYAFGVTAAPRVTDIALTTGPNTALAFGSGFPIKGKLRSGGVGLSGQSIILQSAAPGGSFRDTAFVATTDAGGVFSFSVKPTSKTYYRARFAGTATYHGSGPTASVYALPRVYVRTPIAPKKMRPGRSYTVYGYLKPRHASGTKPVQVKCYKKNSAGVYKYHHTVYAKVSDYYSYSKYKAKVKLPHRGKWRLRAYARADSQHASSWSSGYDYVTVK